MNTQLIAVGVIGWCVITALTKSRRYAIEEITIWASIFAEYWLLPADTPLAIWAIAIVFSVATSYAVSQAIIHLFGIEDEETKDAIEDDIDTIHPSA